MRKILFALLICCLGQLSAALMEVHGTFKGKHLIVQNPFDDSTKTFCITSIYMNGRDLKVDTKHLMIELYFEKYLSIGDKINLRIYHKGECHPEVVNPGAIKRSSIFSFISFKVNATNYQWATRGEQKGSEFTVQRYQNGEWDDVKSKKSKGGMSGNNYEMPSNHYSGVNRYRIQYVQLDGFIEYSDPLDYKSLQRPVSFFPTKVKGKITFVNNLHRPVKFSIYDIDGHKIMEGEGMAIDCTSLQTKEVYTLVFDNQHRRFQKMKSDK
tara:strand:- start:94 stop:897 length:804 start_codon:yes stop_codon:yes gene_type:complete